MNKNREILKERSQENYMEQDEMFLSILSLLIERSIKQCIPIKQVYFIKRSI